MELKRFKDIIAFKNKDGVNSDDTIIAFHATNLEVAELSEESFNEMTSIGLESGEIPDEKPNVDEDANSALAEWNSEKNPDARSGKLEFGIRSITINVNQICNLKCSYCAAGGDGTYGEPTNQISIEKSFPQLRFFLASLKSGSKFSITFVGGEPLIHPTAIKAIYEYVVNEAKELNVIPNFTIVTNGTLLTGNTAEIVRAMKVHITVSIDGTKDANDLLRPTKNGTSSTDLTLAGIEEISKNRGSILSFGIAAVFANGNEDLVRNYSFFKALSPDWIEFNFAYSEGSKELQLKYLSQMSKIAKIAWTNGGEQELRKIRLFDHYFKMLDAQQLIENHCGAGKTYLMVDAKNKLYTCPWDVGKKDELVGQNELLDHEKLAKYSKSLIELNNCQSCWARHLCGGGCMYIHKAHTGDKHKKDNLFCERTRSLILDTLLYYKRARSANV